MRSNKKRIDLRYASAFVILFALEACIAIFIHDDFVRLYIGDVLVVILVYCFVRIFIQPLKLLPLYVFAFATCVEIAQYFNFVELLGLQDNRIARIVFGTVFDIHDILCYFVGCALLFVYQAIIRYFTTNTISN